MSNVTILNDLENLHGYWVEYRQEVDWEPLFVLPPWLLSWQKVFAPGARIYIPIIEQEKQIVGIAPLMIRDNTATIIGSPDVCDYADFIVVPGKESDFFALLLENLRHGDIKTLELKALRPDSAAMQYLPGVAEKNGYNVIRSKDEISLEVKLPSTWEEYLQILSSKQRHEMRRKLRRLEETGNISYRFVEKSASVPEFMDIFLEMFTESRADKAAFLTEKAETFFRNVTVVMAEAGLLRAGILELDDKPVAAIIAFDYNDTAYLYNSGYDPEYSPLSVGVLSKALYIKNCIERKKKKFDFLKGNEHYKYHLGGKEVQLSNLRIEMK